MSATDAVVALIGIAAFGLPMVAIALGVKRFMQRRHDRMDELSELGPVGSFHVPLMLGIIIGGLGAFLLAVGIIPFLVWIVDGDTDARRAALGIVGVSLFFVLAGFLIALPGLKIWLIDGDELVSMRFKKRKAVQLTGATAIRERRSLTGAWAVVGPDNSIVVPMQLSGFDEFMSAIRCRTPDVELSSFRTADKGRRGTDPSVPLTERPIIDLGVGKTRIRATVIGLGLFLLFFWIGPWLVVNGEHPTRDAIIFMGIGTFIWALFALLLGKETFPKGQPAYFTLREHDFSYRMLRRSWVDVRNDELYSASVETRIQYVKGMPGYLYPLVIVLVDGTRIELDQMRAKHMSTTTQSLGAELRRRYVTASMRTHAQRAASDAHVEAAGHSETAEDADQRISALRLAIAANPDADRLAMYRIVGDLQRTAGDNEAAVSSYRAHLDFFSDDHAAWEGLAAALQATGKPDSAAEATAQAERILLNS